MITPALTCSTHQLICQLTPRLSDDITTIHGHALHLLMEFSSLRSIEFAGSHGLHQGGK